MFRSRPTKTEELSESLAPRVAAARDALAPKLVSAREAVTPPLASARQVASDRVLPAAEVARERLAPVVNRASDAILDAVLPAVTAAAEAYEKSQAVEEIRRRGEAAVATIRAEGPEFARRRWPLIVGLMLTGATVGALVGVVTRKRAPEPVWAPPVLPPAPPPPAEASAAGMGDLGDVSAARASSDLESPAELRPDPADEADDVAGDVAVDIDPVETQASRSEQ